MLIYKDFQIPQTTFVDIFRESGLLFLSD
jgi:hypothetical protein